MSAFSKIQELLLDLTLEVDRRLFFSGLLVMKTQAQWHENKGKGKDAEAATVRNLSRLVSESQAGVDEEHGPRDGLHLQRALVR